MFKGYAGYYSQGRNKNAVKEICRERFPARQGNANYQPEKADYFYPGVEPAQTGLSITAVFV